MKPKEGAYKLQEQLNVCIGQSKLILLWSQEAPS